MCSSRSSAVGGAISFLACLMLVGTGSPRAQGHGPSPEVRDALKQAKLDAGRDLSAQAEALVALAWPDGGDEVPHELRAAARQDLVDYGKHSARAIRQAITRVDPLHQADATAALIEAGYSVPTGPPPSFIAGLDEALWLGSPEAKRLAMLELGRRPAHPPAVLSIIDAITENPILTTLGIRTLGRIGDQRARFFLTTVVERGPDPWRAEAARSLTRVGRTGFLMLRSLAASDEREVREPAVAALLPHSTVEDLTLLLEYYGFQTEDDPELRERVRERALELEIELDKQQTGTPDEADS